MQVFSFTKYLLKHKIDEIINVHPSYNSVMVSLSSNVRIKQIVEFLKESISNAKNEEIPRGNEIKVPVQEWNNIVDDAFLGERGKNFIGNKDAFISSAKLMGLF